MTNSQVSRDERQPAEREAAELHSRTVDADVFNDPLRSCIPMGGGFGSAVLALEDACLSDSEGLAVILTKDQHTAIVDERDRLRLRLGELLAEPDVLRTAFDVRRLYHDWRWKGLAPHRRPVMGEEIDDSVAFGLYVHRLPRASSSVSGNSQPHSGEAANGMR